MGHMCPTLILKEEIFGKFNIADLGVNREIQIVFLLSLNNCIAMCHSKLLKSFCAEKKKNGNNFPQPRNSLNFSP